MQVKETDRRFDYDRVKLLIGEWRVEGKAVIVPRRCKWWFDRREREVAFKREHDLLRRVARGVGSWRTRHGAALKRRRGQDPVSSLSVANWGKSMEIEEEFEEGKGRDL